MLVIGGQLYHNKHQKAATVQHIILAADAVRVQDIIVVATAVVVVRITRLAPQALYASMKIAKLSMGTIAQAITQMETVQDIQKYLGKTVSAFFTQP